MSVKEITIESIVKNLNINELVELCEQYGIKPPNAFTTSTGIYRVNLIRRMSKKLGESLHRHSSRVLIAFFLMKPN